MKIRMKGSTVRLRLRRSEIEQLAANGRVDETVNFAGGELVYSLVLDDGVRTSSADFNGSEICVRLPKKQGLEWCQGTETTVSSAGVVPTVLIERDFVRSAVEEADDFDRFTNPRTGRTPPPPPPAA